MPVLGGAVPSSARARRRGTRRRALALSLSLLACGPEQADDRSGSSGAPALPPTAKPTITQALLAEESAERHPADGAGRAWLERGESESPVVTGTARRFRLVFEVGPLGIAEGGSIWFNPSPFWGWSPPQRKDPSRYGYTEVSTDAEGVSFRTEAFSDPHLLMLRVRGRALRPGERVRLVYGAGRQLAVVDRYAERGERFWFWVDGDGDGERQPLLDSPSLDVDPGPIERMVVWLPATAQPGQTVRATVALLDARANAGRSTQTVVRLESPPGLRGPAEIALRPEAGGRGSAEVQVLEEGVYRLRTTTAEGLAAESNPMVVRAGGPRLLWGDLHGHTNWSDGTGLPEDYFAYARDAAALDVIALTDHDHWGMPFLDRSPERWEAIRRDTERFHEPGRFVTVLGYEWTNWIHGHRHVLYFDGRGDVLSSIDPLYDTPGKLWQALRGRDALTFAHHSAGGPVATDWSFAPDAQLEPVTEVVSVHGSSEAPDSPIPIHAPVAGNWVRDVLDRGYRLGLIGSGDSHDGHPGLAHLASSSGGGLAGIWCEELTREGVLAALRARRVYATNGPRIWLQVSLGEHHMGETISLAHLAAGAGAGAPPGETHPELAVRVAATAPVERVDVIHAGAVVASEPGAGRRELALRWVAPELRAGEYLYVRVVQEDRGAAWSSPFFLVE
jgi:hypothetical protein